MYTYLLVLDDTFHLSQKVMENAGAAVRAREIMYKAVVQTVLLYGSESWVMKGEILVIIEGFHHKAAIWMAGKTDRCAGDGGRKCPPVE